MGSVETDVYGFFKYGQPECDDASQRAFYSFPRNTVTRVERQQLYDMRTSTDIIKGSQGLDTHGFAWIKHKSSLSGDAWFAPGNAENIYAPEVLDIIRDTTGADRAVVDGMSFRRRIPNDQDKDESFVLQRGCDIDVAVSKMPRQVMRGT